MHFSLAGDVHACCQNGTYSYGDVTTTSLVDIWEGARRRAMVEELDGGRYPLGCEGCAIEHGLGNRRSTPAQAFDVFSEGPSRWPRQLEFTLSNRCNLACIQCNGDNSSTIRAQREGRPPLPMPYGEGFFEQLPPFLERAEVVSFLGGEPFLAPEARRVWDLLLAGSHRPVVRVTTNATVWSAAVERYVHGLEMHLALSIDGATKETYERIRVGASYERVIAIRDRMVAASRGYGGYLHLNFCLMPWNWQEVGRFLLQADELDVDANVIPVFGPADHSLFTLPREELSPIVAALEGEDGEVRARLGRNRHQWDRVLGLLRDQHERVGSDAGRDAQVVRIRATHARQGALRQRLVDLLAMHAHEARVRAAEALFAEAEHELATWAGRPPVVVTTEADIVTAVQVPPWAEPLRADAWVGVDVADIAAATSWLGEVDYEVPRDLSGGGRLVVVNDSVVHVPGGALHFRTLQAPLLGRMAIASSDPLPVPTPRSFERT